MPVNLRAHIPHIPKKQYFCSVKILDSIRSIFAQRDNHTLQVYANGYGQPLVLTQHKFGETIYLNAAQLLTDLYSEVVWMSAVETPKYKAWLDFVNRNGQRILLQLLRNKGYTVIGYENVPEYVFYELPETAYNVKQNNGREYVECKDPQQLFYVLKSPTYEQTGASDHWHCRGYIAMLDAVLNAATTTSERLGAYVVMSPKQDNFGGVLTSSEKDKLEKELQTEYGMLSKQKQVMVMPRPMDNAVVSLANVDIRMNDKARLAILAIADRLKVPANQIGIIDANSSKTLSNGTELREGDLAKYRSFRRLLNATFYDMATELGMQVNYALENEPKTTQGQTIEQ